MPHPGTFGIAADIGNVPVQWTDTIANDGLLELANRQILGGGADAPLVGQPGAAIAFLLPQHPFILVAPNAAALDVFLPYLRGNLIARFGCLVNLAGFSYSIFTVEVNLGTFNG